MHDVIYAFDADLPGNPLWTRDYRSSQASPISYNNSSSGTSIGILGTPVINPSNNRMFFVTSTTEAGAPVLRIHAIDIRFGAELGSSIISGSYQGATFNPSQQINRPGLALSNGQVFVALGTLPPGDFFPYAGWVMTFDENTLAKTGTFATSVSLAGAGIWQSGAAPAVDSTGNVYYVTGNSSVAYNPANNFNESLLQLSYNSGVKLSSWFTAAEWSFLDSQDLDLGSAGAVLIPGTDLVAFGGKAAEIYLAHTGSLGHLVTNNTQLQQSFHVGTGSTSQPNSLNRLTGLVCWQGPSGTLLFAWPGQDHLFSYRLSGGTFLPAGSNSQYTGMGAAGVSLSLSANGSQAGTGILWANRAEATVGATGGELHAFNAENLSQELWNSTMNASRDSIAYPAKFVIPVVGNGRVYQAADNGFIFVYGELSRSPDFSLSSSPASLTVAHNSTGESTVTANALNGFSGSVSYSVSDAPFGVGIFLQRAGSNAVELTVGVSGFAWPGTYPIVVTATSGALSHQTTINLTVSPYSWLFF